ncbi:MAG: hypothetical protein J1G38_06095 [Clostridiales bacterium]|nr:hypothetical protein [Clostridiales bacterium]
MEEQRQTAKKSEKKDGKFVSVLKAIFVHNIGWKLLAIGTSFLMWALVAGLSL